MNATNTDLPPALSSPMPSAADMAADEKAEQEAKFAKFLEDQKKEKERDAGGGRKDERHQKAKAFEPKSVGWLVFWAIVAVLAAIGLYWLYGFVEVNRMEKKAAAQRVIDEQNGAAATAKLQQAASDEAKAASAPTANVEVEAVSPTPAPAALTQADVDRQVAEKLAEAKLKAEMEEKDRKIKELLAEKEAAFDGAKRAGEESLAKERQTLIKDRDAAFAGQAEVRWKPFDENTHVAGNKDKVRPDERKFKVKGGLPKFKVGSKSTSKRVKETLESEETRIVEGIYPVLAPDGGNLILDKTPELENSDRVPFPLYTEGPKGFKQTWWVDGPPNGGNDPG